MNVSFFTKIPYSGRNQKPAVFGNGKNKMNGITARSVATGLFSWDDSPDEKIRKSRELHQMLKQLQRTQKEESTNHVGTLKNKEDGFLELLGTSTEKTEEKPKKVSKYNFKEVSSKIRRAKTSVSAGQAVISAKRSVMQIKRKISAGDGDAEELQLALTHAKRMEMVARKKKHNLEMEEMVAVTRQRDENMEAREEAADLANSLVFAEEEKVAAQEDEIFEARRQMIEEAAAAARENAEEVTDEMLASLNETIAAFGEDILDALEEQMEMLENMEIIDPHMSAEQFEKLKRKHRAAEEKALTKADMDYLKGMVKHQQEMAKSMQSTVAAAPQVSAAVPQIKAAAVPQMTAVPQISTVPVSVDISI